MEWEDIFLTWDRASGAPGPEGHFRMEAARKRVNKNTAEDWKWLSLALENPKRKYFVALVFKRQPVPKRLFEDFMRAAVNELNPSLDEAYITPCLRSYGYQRVNERLLKFLINGSNIEKMGAASAFYWSHGYVETEARDDIPERIRCALLREFVSNDNFDVRRRIIVYLDLDHSHYPESLRSLVPEAIRIAGQYDDEQIQLNLKENLYNARRFSAI
jgi:hypothetical protein